MNPGALSLLANQSHTLQVAAPTDFTHTPLDYCAPSIRLVRIQAARSSDGLVKCQLRHASTASTYLCLSYVWGAEDNCQLILVNDQRFRIRQNLYNFLEEAKQHPQWPYVWFWIDAICIDQSNSTEKNHQVNQMGSIFAGAVQVVAWLGTQKEIVSFLETPRIPRHREKRTRKRFATQMRSARNTAEDSCAILDSSDEEDDYYHGHIAEANADGFRHFCCADYWDRAWITQEVALARYITFMAGEASLAAELISPRHEQLCQLRVAALLLGTTQELRGRSLIYLMDRFKSKKSGVVRDRVFSLLSLCGDGFDVHIDYRVTDLQVAANVLGCCKRSFCLCSIGIVAFVLCVQSQLPVLDHVSKSRSDYAQITLPLIADPDEFDLKKTLSVLYTPLSRGSVLTLKLRSLCRSYHGLLRVHMNHKGNTTSVLYDAENWYYYGGGDLYRGRDIYLRKGCRIKPSFDRQSCIAIFSLKFLYEIIQLNRSLVPCCERVAYEGTTSAWPLSMPALTLRE